MEPQISARSVSGSNGFAPRSANSLPFLDQRRDAAHGACSSRGRGRIIRSGDRTPRVRRSAGSWGRVSTVSLPIRRDRPGRGQGVGEHDLLRNFSLGLGVADQAREGRDAGAGGDHVRRLPGFSASRQRADGFLAHEHGVARAGSSADAGGQGPVRHLDRIELQLLVPGRAGDRIGRKTGFSRVGKPRHHEFAGAKTETPAAGVMRKENSVSVKNLASRNDRSGKDAGGNGNACALIGAARHVLSRFDALLVSISHNSDRLGKGPRGRPGFRWAID